MQHKILLVYSFIISLTISSNYSKLKSAILYLCNDKCQVIITCIYPHQNISQELENVYWDPDLDFIIWLSYYHLPKHLYTTCNWNIYIELVSRTTSPLFSVHYNDSLRKLTLLKFRLSVYLLEEEDYSIFCCSFFHSSLLGLQSARQSECPLVQDIELIILFFPNQGF